jgi:hypothetical protein
LDRQVEEGEDLTGKLKETALKMLLHSVIYLPLTVPVFFIVANWITRSLKDSVVNCSTSMVVGIPYNIGESTELASKQLASSFSGSFILWPGSSLINFTFIQQWSPGFKSTFDGIVMVLWNSYILAAQGAGDAAGPVAVGPALADRAELTADLKVDASVDCSRFSTYAIARWIVESIWSAIYWSVLYLFYFLQWCFFHHQDWSISHWVLYPAENLGDMVCLLLLLPLDLYGCLQSDVVLLHRHILHIDHSVQDD